MLAKFSVNKLCRMPLSSSSFGSAGTHDAMEKVADIYGSARAPPLENQYFFHRYFEKNIGGRSA